MSQNATEVSKVLEDLDGGVFASQVSAALADAALAVVEHGDGNRKAKVTIELTFARIGESSQANISHKLSYSMPTHRGKRGEETTTQTPMYVSRGGRLTIAPENQVDMFSNADQERT